MLQHPPKKLYLLKRQTLCVVQTTSAGIALAQQQHRARAQKQGALLLLKKTELLLFVVHVCVSPFCNS